MNKKNEQELLTKVKEDYEEIANEFDITRQYKWKEFKNFIQHLKNKQNISDLGCGNGRLYNFIEQNLEKFQYTGIDNVDNFLRIAKKQHPKGKFIKGKLEKIPLKNKSSDIVFAIASFHHLPSKELRIQSLKEIHRILKKDGIFIMTNWNLFQKKYKKYTWKARIKSILSLGRYGTKDTFIPWAKTSINRYYYAFKENELKNLLKNNGFKIISIETDRNITTICKKKN